MFNNYTKTLYKSVQHDNLVAVTHIKTGKATAKSLSATHLRMKTPDTENYLVCGDRIAHNADFFGLNRFSWCVNSTISGSGYSALYDRAEDYPIPIFFSATGCNEVRERNFDDQQAILGWQMNDRFFGAVIYEWREEATPDKTTSNSRLSTGAKIATGIIVLVVSLTFAITSFFRWQRRRQARTKAAPDEKAPEYSKVAQEQNIPGVGVGEFYNTPGSEVEGNPEDSRQELGSQIVYHIGGQERRLPELDAYSPPLELDIGRSMKRHRGVVERRGLVER
ncbi:MAG: hypothetical protein Q9225_000017 [Loekoesia sp. 1 TL-2023]